MSEPLRRSDGLTRRRILAHAARSFLGVGLLDAGLRAEESTSPPPPSSPQASSSRAKNVIYLYMDGGMSHVDTWDPKSGEVAGPTKTIDTSVPGVRLGEYLPRTAKWMQHGAVVRSLSSTQGAHEQGNYLMHTSYELRGTIAHPSMGAWLSRFRGAGNPSLPATVYIGNASRHPGAGFLPPTHSPLFVNNPANGLKDIELRAGLTADGLRDRLALAAALDADFLRDFSKHGGVSAHAESYDGAVKMMACKDVAAFDLTQEPVETRDAYGKEPFGQGCLLARRLVERGLRFVEVGLHGWDTHSGNFIATPELCRQLDGGLASLIGDLHDRGLLKETLVVVATEFGRTPKINVNLGRDHYPKAFSAALFGGGVASGSVFGGTDETGEEVVEDVITPQDFNATLGYALGLPLNEIVFSPSRRPFKIADKGKPVVKLFS